MFGVETRAWSLTTSSSHVRDLLAAAPEPDRRTWLVPGPLAPVCRVRRSSADTFLLRLSPGDPRRGPGSADRLTVTVHDGRVDCAQRPGPVGRLVVGALFVAAWAVATLMGTYAVVSGDLRWLLGVPVVLVFRTVAETGRRLDERRYRRWLRNRLDTPPSSAGPSGTSPVPAACVAVAAPVWSVPDADCSG